MRLPSMRTAPPAGTGAPVAGPVDRDGREGAVVTGSDDRVVHGRVEAPARSLPRRQRELHDAEQVGAGIDRAMAVQLRELGVVAKAR